MSSRASYLALGDSYTIGEGVAPGERWPVLLVHHLRESGASISNPEIVARTGWTTDELMTAIHEAPLKESYELVSLLIGVNNQYRGRSPGEYRAEFTELLDYAVKCAGGFAHRVIVLSIPDWGVTPFAEGRDRARIALEIDEFNAMNRAESDRRGAYYVDVTPISRAEKHRDLLVADGLHPAGAMYDMWARLALPAAEQALAALHHDCEPIGMPDADLHRE
ncbi:SGNH/GDSL hydrolase family protein [soil metagenome]